MERNTQTAEKRIVNQLQFDADTARRVGWENFEFKIIGTNLVEVTNASYGSEKEDHAYTVGIDSREDDPVPVDCSCPADTHREPDCKHKLALATVGGTTVLQAAVDFRERSPDSSVNDSQDEPELKADGGFTEGREIQETCPNGDPNCHGPDADELPCFGCYSPTEAL
jgi:hypothetical protein